jgi:hypothetical protein
MKRLNVLNFYELGQRIGRLQHLLKREHYTISEVFFVLIELRTSAKNFVDEQDAFRLSKEDAKRLMETIDSVVSNYMFEDKEGGRRDFKDFSTALEPWMLSSLSGLIESLTHVFQAECRDNETYFVERKLIYDTSALLHQASAKIHHSVRDLVSNDALSELDQAGRCLALESYTASGFHALRALEVVMASYYEAINRKPGEFRSWFDYIKALEGLVESRGDRKSAYPSPKVVAMLDRIRQLDRNPLMHPRDVLDEMSADTLFTISVATITEMAKDIRELAATPEQSELSLVVPDEQTEQKPKKRISGSQRRAIAGPTSGDAAA